jgi:hypothetical protein
MPESSRRVFASHHARITKTVDAPIKYVYAWCTDFRSDDGRLSGSKPRFKVIYVGSDRVVRIRMTNPGAKTPSVAVELVRLFPPDGWHVDQIDETDLDAVDYKLARLGPRKTRVSLSITERWMSPNHPSRTEWVRGTSKFWDNLVAALEQDYEKGMPAKG